jgi:hypothetical protein
MVYLRSGVSQPFRGSNLVYHAHFFMQENQLNTKIADLPFSDDLKTILAAQNLVTLKDLLNLEVNQWHQFPGFNYHKQHEIVQYLTHQDLMSFLKE